MKRFKHYSVGFLAIMISIGLNNTQELACIATSPVNILPANLEPNTVYMRVECTDVTQATSFEINKNIRDNILDGELTYGYWYDRMGYLMENDPQWQRLFQ